MIKNNVGSPPNDQLSDSRFRSGAAQVGMIPQGFHDCHHSHGQPLCRLRLV
jgi:hypothetical protein